MDEYALSYKELKRDHGPLDDLNNDELNNFFFNIKSLG